MGYVIAAQLQGFSLGFQRGFGAQSARACAISAMESLESGSIRPAEPASRKMHEQFVPAGLKNGDANLPLRAVINQPLVVDTKRYLTSWIQSGSPP